MHNVRRLFGLQTDQCNLPCTIYINSIQNQMVIVISLMDQSDPKNGVLYMFTLFSIDIKKFRVCSFQLNIVEFEAICLLINIIS